jgi:hypothetical protein
MIMERKMKSTLQATRIHCSSGSRKVIEVHRGRSQQIQTRREGASLLAKETGGLEVRTRSGFFGMSEDEAKSLKQGTSQ